MSDDAGMGGDTSCKFCQAQQFGMQQGVGQYKEQDVGQCRVQRHAGFRTMPGVRISDARVLRQHQGQEWGTMPGMGRKQINVTNRRRHQYVMPTYICFCYVCCIPVHHKGKSGFFLSPWSQIWRVFVRCGAGRRTHRPFCGARRRQTGKMEPDKDSKIEAKRIRNTQKRAITHNWTIPSRGPEFEPLGSKWNPNGIH